MENELLQTKLRAPPLRTERVVRQRLVARLDAGFVDEIGWGRKVTLVSAPAGYGKSTLLSGWRAEAEHPVVWLSLEERDNDLARFLAYLIAALRQVYAGTGKATMDLLAAGGVASAEALLVPLLNVLASEPAPLTIVLDDYHVIHLGPIHEALAFFVAHQPPQLHLIISTREDPPLPLARWRAAGQLEEIRMGDLRFSRVEVAAFLREVMNLRLDDEQIAALETRTEGWIAGLQLAAVALQGRDDADAFVQSFAGSNRYILDYLLEEVFGQQPATVQDFLLVTSILERFTASLAAALHTARAAPGTEPPGQPAVRAILDYLERANLFVVSLDDRRQWFRYHQLFTELLRHQLRLRNWPTEPLHGAAGRWYAERGMAEPAIDHFLAGQAWREAALWIGSQSEALLRRGESRTLLRWLEELPEEVIRSQPQLCLSNAWTLLFAGQAERAAGYLDTVEGLAANREMRYEVLAARAYMARMQQDLPGTIALSREALALAPEGDSNARGILSVGLGLAYWQSGRVKEADEALFEAIQATRQVGNHYAQLIASGFLGTVRATMGQLRGAVQLLEEALRWGQDQPPASVAHHVLGALLYEWNDLERAGDHLQQAVALARRSANAEMMEGAYRELARLQLAQGEWDAAAASLADAWRAVGQEASSLTRSRLAAAQVQLALAQGDILTAARWADQRTLPVDASPFYPRLDLTPARLALARGEKQLAASKLAAAAAQAEQGGWQYGLLETRVLQTLAAPDEDMALFFLLEALRQAQPEGYVRTFIDKGEPLALLLRRVPAQGPLEEFAELLLLALGRSVSTSEAASPPITGRAPPLLEPLSERELEIIGLLASGRSNAEIAQALTVSVNTIKTHLRHIYEKLDVHDRRAAVRRADELNLLPPRQSL